MSQRASGVSRRLRAVVSLAVAALGASCAARTAAHPDIPSPPISPDEAEVIVAAIARIYEDAPWHVLLSPVGGGGNTPEGSASLRADINRALPAAPPDLVDSYVIRGQIPLDLSVMVSQLARLGPVRLATSEELDAFRSRSTDAYWRKFYERFPGAGGLITVTRPGFSADGSKALLYLGRSCGMLCGTWGYVLLRRENGRWVVAAYATTAVS